MKTQELIASLTKQANRPVVPLTMRRVGVESGVIALLALAMNLAISGLRPDWQARIAEPAFVTDVISVALLALCAGICTFGLAYPDRAHRRWPVVLFWCAFALQVMAAVWTLWFMPPVNDAPAHTIECLSCIVMVALLPSGWLWWRLRQLASVRPAQMALCATTMALALGCLGVRMVEDHVATAGMLSWHYLPLWGFAALGWVSGKRLFRW